ncbi:hypothetical protein [Denitromonas iodatirespirans]|uniref:Uncharacterized protein n=1 Tax=Denitromonas iodatirespirans TaxID=2795389 RepID=A0A944DGF7_DENI1|nr:hypothetical protein [Denitromonas iodatirespirans]MBT0963868.1 hypothetical protein [Denitromonas iodatirespirans]
MLDHNNSAKIDEDIYAGKLLNVMARSINSELTTFSTWMVAGFGAAIGLLVANIEKVAPYISPNAVGASTKLFLVAVILNVVQRYLAAILTGSVAAGKEAESISPTAPIDISSVLNEIERATLWPARYMVRWSNRRILAGDFVLGGRLNAWSAQIQGWLVLAQMLAVVTAAWEIANALKGQ